MFSKERIEATADWLTEHYGSRDWAERIDLDILDMQYDHTCILGQLEGRFTRYCRMINLERGDANEMLLSLPFNTDSATYNCLNGVWKEFIMGYRYSDEPRPESKHGIEVSVTVHLTATQIGEIYVKASERGTTVEDYIKNEVQYAAERITY